MCVWFKRVLVLMCCSAFSASLYVFCVVLMFCVVLCLLFYEVFACVGICVSDTPKMVADGLPMDSINGRMFSYPSGRIFVDQSEKLWSSESF